MFDILYNLRSDYDAVKMRQYLCGVLDDAEDCLEKSNQSDSQASCKTLWFASRCWSPVKYNTTALKSCSSQANANATSHQGFYVGQMALHCNSTIHDWNPRLLKHSCFGPMDDEYDDESPLGNSTFYEYGTQETVGSTSSVAEVLEYLGRTEAAPGELPNDRYSTFMKVVTAGHALSIMSLLIALVLLSMLRRLHCTRISVHMNLMLSFMLRGLIWFVHYFAFQKPDEAIEEAELSTMEMLPIILGRHYSSDVGLIGGVKQLYCNKIEVEHTYVWCRIYFVVLNYLITASYFWLLVEGLYLRLLLRAVVFSHKKYMRAFMALGWGIPWLSVLTVVILKCLKPEENPECWFDFNKGAHWWIINTPIQLSLLVNFVIFIMVVREVGSKLKVIHQHQVEDRNDNYRWRLTKSTLALVPLLGVQYVVSAILELASLQNPNVVFALKAYELGFTAIQGLLIAFLYCFCNGEVQEECAKLWKRLKIRWELSRMEQNHLKALRRRKSGLFSNSSMANTTSYFMTSRKPSGTDPTAQRPAHITIQFNSERSQRSRSSLQSCTSDKQAQPDVERKLTVWRHAQPKSDRLSLAFEAPRNYDIADLKRHSSPGIVCVNHNDSGETVPLSRRASSGVLHLKQPSTSKQSSVINVKTPLLERRKVDGVDCPRNLDSLDSVCV